MDRGEPRIIGRPESGYFLMRLVKGGPLVPARIVRSIACDPETGETLDRSPHTWGEIGGEDADYHQIWHYGQRCSREEYEYRMTLRQWAIEHAQERPEATPRDPIDLMNAPLPF